jgi:hypothetical protein
MITCRDRRKGAIYVAGQMLYNCFVAPLLDKRQRGPVGWTGILLVVQPNDRHNPYAERPVELSKKLDTTLLTITTAAKATGKSESNNTLQPPATEKL